MRHLKNIWGAVKCLRILTFSGWLRPAKACWLPVLLLAIGLQAAPWSPATVDNFTPSLMRGLVAYWKLDEASGTRYDSWTNGYHLTDINSTTAGAGILNNGAFPSGGYERLSILNATLNSTLTNISTTFSFWYKYTKATTDNGSIFHTDNTSGTHPFIYFVAGRTQTNVLEVYSFSGTTYTPVYTNTAGNFYFVSFRQSGTNCSISVNGETPITITKNFAGNANAFVIGSLAAFVDGQGAVVDEFLIHDRPITQGEREFLYNLGKARRFGFVSGP